MSREEGAVRAAQSVLTGGKGGLGATVNKQASAIDVKAAEEAKQDAAFEGAVQGIGKEGIEAGKTTSGDWVLSHLPAIFAPNSNLAQQHLDQYNDGVMPAATRLLGDRVPPEFIKEQIEQFKIKPTDPPAISADKVAKFQTFLRTNRELNIGAKKGAQDNVTSEVPGAVPAGQ